MRKLDRYIAANVLGATTVVLVVLVFLEGLFSFLGELGDVRGNYQTMDALLYTIFQFPKKIYEFIPVSALVGCLAGLGSMASSSELVVMRAAGVSLWRMVWAVIKPALLMVMIGSLAWGICGSCGRTGGKNQPCHCPFFQRYLHRFRYLAS